MKKIIKVRRAILKHEDSENILIEITSQDFVLIRHALGLAFEQATAEKKVKLAARLDSLSLRLWKQN